MPTASRTRLAPTTRLVTVTLVPARMRSAYVETRCLMQRADGATAEERAPYFADHTIEVSFAEAAEGRTSDGYLVRRVDDAGITITVGAVERSGGVWFYRSARDVRKTVQAGELVCDGAQRADRVVLAADAPGRVLLASGFGWGCRTRSEALALAGFAVA